MAKQIVSEKYKLIKQDLLKWGKNALIFAAPMLVVFLTSIQAGQPLNEALNVVWLYMLNVFIDLLKKFVKENKY